MTTRYSLTGNGITSDAAGAIGYGSTAPSGTDRTAAIQAVIDGMASGSTLIWDVAVGLSGPLYIPSNFTIFAPSRAYGAIMRSAANSPMFRLNGMQTAPVDDTTTASQNCFGKQDSGHAGDERYRVLDASFFNAEDIRFIGGTWNGNKAQQTGHPFTAGKGFLSLLQFWGAKHVHVEGGLFIRPHSALPLHFVNCDDVTIKDIEFDGSALTSTIGSEGSMAGIQIDGPCRNFRIYDFDCHSDDDCLGICAETASAANINTTYAGGSSVCVPGVNYSENGDITDIRAYGMKLTGGAEGVAGSGCVRLLSNVHTIDDVEFHGFTGRTTDYAFIMGALTTMAIDGTGNMGRVLINDCQVEIDSPAAGANEIGYAVFDIQGGGPNSHYVIKGRRRGLLPASAVPDVSIRDPAVLGATVIQSLTLEGEYFDDGTGGNVAAAQIKVATTVKRIFANTRSSRAASVTAVSSPVLLTATGAVIDLFAFNGDLNRATNIVKHVAGTLTTTHLQGSHRNSNGGSPVDVASGKTITNVWDTDLAYARANAALKSGSGSVTNSSGYVEAALAGDYVLDNFAGTNGDALNARTPSPTPPSPSANWAKFIGTAANQTVQSNKASFSANNTSESIVVDTAQKDGTITTIINFDATIGALALVIFRASDASNYWQLAVGTGGSTLYKVEATIATPVASDINSHTAATNYTVTVVLNGNSVSTQVGAETPLTDSGGFNSTATKHGGGYYAPTAGVGTIDTFRQVA